MAFAGAKWGAWVRIMCALALFCIGLAHKPPVIVAEQIPVSELANYVLPDGTVAILCLPGQGDDGKSHILGSGCEACRLSGSMILPSPPTCAGEQMALVLAVVIPPPIENIHRQTFPPNAAPRAPPLFDLIA